MDKRRLGASGEDRAAAQYVADGYQVLDRNWRCSVGEIDLVCRRGKTVVFCEVRTRTSLACGHPLETVTSRKQQRMRRLAARWLVDHPSGPCAVRFDVVAVLGQGTEVLEGAF